MLTKSNTYALDILSFHPELKVNGERRYTTKIGLFFTIIAVALVLTLSVFFLIQTFDRQNLNLVFSQDSTIYPVTNLTDIPFTMTVHGRYAAFPEQQRVFSVKAQFVEYFTKPNAQGVPTVSFRITPVPMVPCELEKHFGQYKYMFKDAMMTYRYCAVPGSVNMTLYGKWGDTKNGNSHLDVRIFKCDNKTVTGDRTCYDDATINKYLGNAYTTIQYVDFDIQPKNYTNPLIPIYQSEMLQFGTGLYKTFYSIRTNTQIRTDEGFLFEDFYQITSSSYARTETVVTDKAEDPSFGIAQYIVYHNKRVEIYTRSYMKIQQLLANIGGVLKAILIIAHLIVNQISLSQFKLYMINLLFSFGQPREKNEKCSLTSLKNCHTRTPSKASLKGNTTKESQL